MPLTLIDSASSIVATSMSKIDASLAGSRPAWLCSTPIGPHSTTAPATARAT